MNRSPAAPNGAHDRSAGSAPHRPPQFPLGSLLGLMVVVGIAMAPAFYILRGQQGDSASKLAGMLMILAGPLLLMTLLSTSIGLYRWWKRR